VTGLVGFTLSAWLPDPFGRSLAGATGLVLFASWMGYPLILVFATPFASPTRAVRRTAVATALTLVACLVIGSRVDSIALSLAGFAAVVFLCTIGAHVLGTAEHRLGLYRPLQSFLAVLAMLYWPIEESMYTTAFAGSSRRPSSSLPTVAKRTAREVSRRLMNCRTRVNAPGPALTLNLSTCRYNPHVARFDFPGRPSSGHRSCRSNEGYISASPCPEIQRSETELAASSEPGDAERGAVTRASRRAEGSTRGQRAQAPSSKRVH
jgi:hypothetical protein